MTRPDDESGIIYDWNRLGFAGPLAHRRVQLLDETLRDGLQSPSVMDPSIQDKKAILRLMESLGIGYADVGLPGAGRRAYEDVAVLCETIRDEGLKIRPCCAARTHPDDVRPILEIAESTGVEIEVLTFLGSSPIRIYAEGWELPQMLRLTTDAVCMAVDAGLPVAFVTEDTTRSQPHILEPLFERAIDCGAHRLVLCDTVGHASPDGVRALITWTQGVLSRLGADVGLDWHGHNDRGLGVVNSLYAIQYGCDRVHGCALGLGERVGNASMDQMLVNLRLVGAIDNELTDLMAYCRTVSVATRWRIPRNYPVVGEDAFRTATGVHAAAILKAKRKGDDWLADRIYSGVPAAMVGKRQEIQVGHMSGESNAIAWLADRNIEPTRALVAEIMVAAKRANRTMHDDEIEAIVRRHLASKA